jgi:hypothetical protein
MSSIDENIKEFEETEKKLIEEFNIRLELIEDDELKNLLLTLRDLILVEAALSTVKSTFTLQKMLELRNELRLSKDFRDRYL